MSTMQKTETQLKQEQIAIRAYHLWEREGRHHHHDLEFWLEAESLLGAALPNLGWNWRAAATQFDDSPAARAA